MIAAWEKAEGIFAEVEWGNVDGETLILHKEGLRIWYEMFHALETDMTGEKLEIWAMKFTDWCARWVAHVTNEGRRLS